MICPKCGKESVKDALYCEWCSTKLKSENQGNERYILYNSKQKNLLLIFIAFLMIGISIFVICSNKDELTEVHIYGIARMVSGHPILIKVIAWVCLLFFGVGFFVFLSGRYIKKPCLILDSEGLYIGVNYLGGFRGKLSWKEIKSISVSEMLQQRMIRIDFIPIQHNSALKRRYSIIQKLKNGPKIAYLPLFAIKEDEQIIMEQLHRYKEKYKPKCE